MTNSGSTSTGTHEPGVPPGGKVTYINGRRIILDKDGKPCRACNTLTDFRSAMGKGSAEGGASLGAFGASLGAFGASTKPDQKPVATDCPPDVVALGRATWTFLHSMAASYPENPSESEKSEMKSFFHTFGRFYPCWYCASDFRKWMDSHEPKVDSQQDLNLWLCDAHNEVNKKLGKPSFSCSEWKYRWKHGWPDGRCD